MPGACRLDCRNQRHPAFLMSIWADLECGARDEFVEKILVHQAEGKGASRTQEVEIFFNFIGKVEIPRKEIELTEEEKAALAEQERRRAKKAEYNRRYMEKKRRQWKEQQEREKEQQEALELPAASTEKGERIA